MCGSFLEKRRGHELCEWFEMGVLDLKYYGRGGRVIHAGMGGSGSGGIEGLLGLAAGCVLL